MYRDRVDEGNPIAYEVLEKGVAVIGCDGQELGSVHHVVSDEGKDIFHGLVISTAGGRRFVEAADVAALHEHRVDLRIDAAAAARLPEPGGRAPVFAGDPAAMGTWSHWVNRLTLRKDWRGDG